MLTRCSEVGLADLDDVLVVAQQGATEVDSVDTSNSGTATKAKHDRESRVAGERDWVLTIHPDRTIAVVHVTGVGSSRVLSDSTESATTCTGQDHRANIHDGLSEIPAQNSIMEHISKLCNLSSGVDWQTLADACDISSSVTDGKLSRDAEDIVCNAARHATAFLQVGFCD